jgi:hypothetical protein
MTAYTGTVVRKIPKPSFKTLKGQFHAVPWRPSEEDMEAGGSCAKLCSYNIMEVPAHSDHQEGESYFTFLPISLGLRNPVDSFDPTVSGVSSVDYISAMHHLIPWLVVFQPCII